MPRMDSLGASRLSRAPTASQATQKASARKQPPTMRSVSRSARRHLDKTVGPETDERDTAGKNARAESKRSFEGVVGERKMAQAKAPAGPAPPAWCVPCQYPCGFSVVTRGRRSSRRYNACQKTHDAEESNQQCLGRRDTPGSVAACMRRRGPERAGPASPGMKRIHVRRNGADLLIAQRRSTRRRHETRILLGVPGHRRGPARQSRRRFHQCRAIAYQSGRGPPPYRRHSVRGRRSSCPCR